MTILYVSTAKAKNEPVDTFPEDPPLKIANSSTIDEPFLTLNKSQTRSVSGFKLTARLTLVSEVTFKSNFAAHGLVPLVVS